MQQRALPYLLIVLLAATVCHPGSAATVRWFVVSSGPLAGTQLGAGSQGVVLPDANFASGTAGRVEVTEAASNWAFLDEAGASGAVIPLPDLPEHVRQLSHAVSVLRAVAL